MKVCHTGLNSGQVPCVVRVGYIKWFSIHVTWPNVNIGTLDSLGNYSVARLGLPSLFSCSCVDIGLYRA